ncbi:hypothetical protein CAEBREN_25498 [Caenorhabditis brenneri]|uniref:RING-type domain-containing protein n=1 Tax=Caenorhabditis brenneri TaxID=135651 RepID=G0NEH9_CAEBE|nr:hypothetical protein CAEBREN_25498 [Caenorhabditis brenneri]
MSHFASLVNPDLTMLSSVLQEDVIRKFLPSELIPAGWSCQKRSLIENVQSLYKTSNKRIQVYGSPESLEKTLEIFMSFPGNQQFFHLKDYDVYKTYLPIYKSLGGNAYFYKKEMYELLIHHTPKFNTLAPLQRLAYNLISFYLRTLKNKLATSHEMIGLDINLMEVLVVKNLKFEMMMERGDWKTYPTSFAFEPKNSGQVLNYISDLLTQSETGVKMGSGLRKKISMVTDDVPVEENEVEYKKMLTWLDITLQYFNTIINNNKMMFLARSETVDSIPASKIPIRLFESNEERVVMSHELLHAIKLEKLDVSGLEDRIMAMPKLSALSFRDVFQMIPSDIFKMLEFVRIPQPPLLRDLRMIPTIDGNNCLTTWQFFLMIFDDAILIKRLFQGMKGKQWPPIMAEFYTMLMDTLRLESYFVTYNTYERIKLKLREKECRLTLTNSEVESLNTTKQELDQKNEQNEKLIATFQEAISKKDLTIMFWQSRDQEKVRIIKELNAEESKAIPQRSTEESEKVYSLLSNLLATKTILSKEDPVKKSNDICDALVSKTNSKLTQQFVKYETRVFQLQVSSYIQTVENNIKLIQGNQAIKSDQIPEIPDFPEFSEEFKNFHKFILKKEAPLLCRQLLNLTDEIADMECVICINEMESHDDTTKCVHCKRRYHNHCIKSWLKTKSVCPTCKHGMVDEQEFPAL